MASGSTIPSVTRWVAVESGIDLHQLLETAEQQPGADDEHDRERDFSRHQPVAHARPRRPGRRPLPAVLEGDAHDLLAQMQQGRHAEDEAGQNGNHRGEEDDPPVERDLNRARNAVGVGREQTAQPAESHRRADSTADQREHDAFGQELPEQPPSTGTEG